MLQDRSDRGVVAAGNCKRQRGTDHGFEVLGIGGLFGPEVGLHHHRDAQGQHRQHAKLQGHAKQEQLGPQAQRDEHRAQPRAHNNCPGTRGIEAVAAPAGEFGLIDNLDRMTSP